MKRIFKNAVVVTMNQENEVITNGQVELDDIGNRFFVVNNQY